jgi:hypothetical protein
MISKSKQNINNPNTWDRVSEQKRYRSTPQLSFVSATKCIYFPSVFVSSISKSNQRGLKKKENFKE